MWVSQAGVEFLSLAGAEGLASCLWGLCCGLLRRLSSIVHSLLSSGVSEVVFKDGVAELAEVVELVQVLLKLSTGQRGFNERSDMAKHKCIQACRRVSKEEVEVSKSVREQIQALFGFTVDLSFYFCNIQQR